jgi:hypothetical protein
MTRPDRERDGMVGARLRVAETAPYEAEREGTRGGRRMPLGPRSAAYRSASKRVVAISERGRWARYEGKKASSAAQRRRCCGRSRCRGPRKLPLSQPTAAF